MIPRINKLDVLSGYQLQVTFDSGKVVIYDVLDDIRTLKDFEPLQTQIGLFQNASLDESRTCVFWNDRIDLSSDTIFEFGRCIKG